MKKLNQGSMHERRGSLFDLEDGLFGAFEEGHDWRVELHAVYEQAQARLAHEDCSDARAIVKAWETAVSFDQRDVVEAIPAQMFLMGAAWQRIETSTVAERAWRAGEKTIAGAREGARSKRLASDEERVNQISLWLARNPGKSASAAFRWLEMNANLGCARTLKRAWSKRK